MCSYLSRDEDQRLQSVKQVFKEAISNGATYYEQMQSATYSCPIKREYSFQKAVYHIMPQQWLRKISQKECEC